MALACVAVVAVALALILASGGSGDRSERAGTPVGTPTASLFPVRGLFAVNGLDAADTVRGRADIGSDREIHFANPALSLRGRLEYLQSFPPYCWNGACDSSSRCARGCGLVQLPGAISVAAVPGSAWADARQTNDDAAIDWGPGTSYSPGAETVSSSANDVSITIPGGTYYFCAARFNGSGVTLKATGSATNPVVIYIDSPARPGSGCAAGTGQLAGANDFALMSTSGVASDLRIYVYGDPKTCVATVAGFRPAHDCPDDLSPNSTSMTADLYAPFSFARFGGPAKLTGAFDIGYIVANNDLALDYQAPQPGSQARRSA